MKNFLKTRRAKYLILGIVTFLIFAYSVEYARSFWTWIFFLISQISLLRYFALYIIDTIKVIEKPETINNNVLVMK
jgi:ABC-type transport system involved in cytochrome c biogenesis permease subunit